MNYETMHEILQRELDGVHRVRNGRDPQEGDMVKDLYGTRVFLDGHWQMVGSDPIDIERLRQRWVEVTSKNRLANELNESIEIMNRIKARRKHRGIDIGSADQGVHLHDSGTAKEVVHILSEGELDSKTLEAFAEGKELMVSLVNQLLDSAIDLDDFKNKLKEHPQWLM